MRTRELRIGVQNMANNQSELLTRKQLCELFQVSLSKSADRVTRIADAMYDLSPTADSLRVRIVILL